MRLHLTTSAGKSGRREALAFSTRTPIAGCRTSPAKCSVGTKAGTAYTMRFMLSMRTGRPRRSGRSTQ
eukprot:9361147-Alexandrium_andersonii.AAC.1